MSNKQIRRESYTFGGCMTEKSILQVILEYDDGYEEHMRYPTSGESL